MVTGWTHAQLLSNVFNATPVPSIDAIWAHYSHWLAQPPFLPASPTLNDFGSTKDINPSHSFAGRLLFTVGCHGGLNVPDTILQPTAAPPRDDLTSLNTDTRQRFLDWAQAYGRPNAAVYVANSGFGYGDTDTIDLSERLYGHLASNLNSGGTIGEQWVRALHQYYTEQANYDVIDEKVMIEANMYGLPFYSFTGTPQNPPPTVDAAEPRGRGRRRHRAPPGSRRLQHRPVRPGNPHLFVDQNHADGSTFTQNGAPWTMGTLSVFYRPSSPRPRAT